MLVFLPPFPKFKLLLVSLVKMPMVIKKKFSLSKFALSVIPFMPQGAVLLFTISNCVFIINVYQYLPRVALFVLSRNKNRYAKCSICIVWLIIYVPGVNLSEKIRTPRPRTRPAVFASFFNLQRIADGFVISSCLAQHCRSLNIFESTIFQGTKLQRKFVVAVSTENQRLCTFL